MGSFISYLNGSFLDDGHGPILRTGILGGMVMGDGYWGDHGFGLVAGGLANDLLDGHDFIGSDADRCDLRLRVEFGPIQCIPE